MTKIDIQLTVTQSDTSVVDYCKGEKTYLS